MGFAQLAQDFVEATSSLVGNRTINIMNQEGIIIASTEKERIGAFHQGAAEVIATGRPVLVKPEELNSYQGAKEGYNMPIFLKDELIGVVGIFGSEKQVGDIANLLRVYVTQYFARQAMNEKKKVEDDARAQILRLLLLGEEGRQETIEQLCDLISVRISYPVRVMILRAQKGQNAAYQMNQLAQFCQSLKWKGILDKKRDIYGIYDGCFVVIYGKRDLEPMIQAALEAEEYTLSISSLCYKLAEIPVCMSEAETISRMDGDKIRNIEQNKYKMQYLIHTMLSYGGNRYIEELDKRLSSDQGVRQMDEMLTTAMIYYQEGGSVTKASERLHLHKNTLMYRMKRLWQLLELEHEQAFVREFFIRILFAYRQEKLFD